MRNVNSPMIPFLTTFLRLRTLAACCALLVAGCADEPGPVETELKGGVISITFRVEERQVVEKDPIVYQLHILTSEPIESAVLEEASVVIDTLETAVGKMDVSFTFQETAGVGGRRERLVRVRAGGEEEVASVIVDVVSRERIPIRFFIVDMTDHSRRLTDGELCYTTEDDPIEQCYPIELDGAVNLAFVESCTFDLYYRAAGYSSFRQSVQRQEGLVVYDRPLFAGWSRPMRFTARSPLVEEGDRLTLYAMPDAFSADLFEASASGGDAEASIPAFAFPIDAVQALQTIPYQFHSDGSPSSDDADRAVDPGVETTIRLALEHFEGLAAGLSVDWGIQDRFDDLGDSELIRIVGDTALASPGLVTFDRTFQVSAVAAGLPAYATAIVYRTAGVGHPNPAAFTLRAAQGALLRTLLPALNEAALDRFAGDDGYTPLAAEHIAVVYAYFGFPELFGGF